jgi:hypothetical protein
MKRTTKKLALNHERVRGLLSDLSTVRGGAVALPTSNVTCLSHEYTECCPPP